MLEHDFQDLQRLFKQCFLASHNTVLQAGAEEPLYSPASQEGEHHIIAFTRDYYASALHEIAHWLVAGEQRRQMEDYGYWYAPDGRSLAQQQEFEKVEVQPQAIEWILAKAAGFRFRVSADNLQAGLGASREFKANIHRRVLVLCKGGLNPRAQTLVEAISQFYDQGNVLRSELYSLADLS